MLNNRRTVFDLSDECRLILRDGKAILAASKGEESDLLESIDYAVNKREQDIAFLRAWQAAYLAQNKETTT